ncbi:NUDIX domain-containing protein [Colwellia sp. E2M01]|uniref:NUDIX hydrolase n=1 Tax=Colwellia sp. E2M01 TaxID=2841561 RepID=UPI0020906865|nr:NUDIX domain-containing protein [Colwellia sp. E2M01]
MYYHNAAAAVAVIIKYRDEILLTVRAKEPGLGKLDLPGGFVDHNETLEAALIREVQEELSLTITPSQLRYFTSEPNTYQFKNILYNTIDALFTVELESKPETFCEQSEIKNILWIKKSELNVNDLAFTSTKAAMKKYLK